MFMFICRITIVASVTVISRLHEPGDLDSITMGQKQTTEHLRWTLPEEPLVDQKARSGETLIFGVSDAAQTASQICKAVPSTSILEQAPLYAVISVNFRHANATATVRKMNALGRSYELAGVKQCVLLKVKHTALYSVWLAAEMAQQRSHGLAAGAFRRFQIHAWKVAEHFPGTSHPDHSRLLLAFTTAAEQGRLDLVSNLLPECSSKCSMSLFDVAAENNWLFVCRFVALRARRLDLMEFSKYLDIRRSPEVVNVAARVSLGFVVLLM